MDNIDSSEEIGDLGTPMPRVRFHKESPDMTLMRHPDPEAWKAVAEQCEADKAYREQGKSASDWNASHEAQRAHYLGKKQ